MVCILLGKWQWFLKKKILSEKLGGGVSDEKKLLTKILI